MGLTEYVPCILNPLNAKLNPMCHLLALLGARHILHVSRIRVNFGTMLRQIDYLLIVLARESLIRFTLDRKLDGPRTWFYCVD
jgi:hypothetical protein